MGRDALRVLVKPKRSRAHAVLLTAACLVATVLVALPSASHSTAGNCLDAGWERVVADCLWDYDDYVDRSTAGDGHVWTTMPLCAEVTNCYGGGLTCEVNGSPGYWVQVYRDGEMFGQVCLPNDRESGPTAAMAARAFRRLSWPVSGLSVEPPGGRTLVNLDTFYFTNNSAPTRRTIRLVGERVRIEAVPVSYRWHFGDGSSVRTSSPGGAYPEGDVVHVYEQPGEVSASVDTVYRGRFRLGGGPWREIPGTLTVSGPAMVLSVMEARPQLVNR